MNNQEWIDKHQKYKDSEILSFIVVIALVVLYKVVPDIWSHISQTLEYLKWK